MARATAQDRPQRDERISQTFLRDSSAARFSNVSPGDLTAIIYAAPHSGEQMVAGVRSASGSKDKFKCPVRNGYLTCTVAPATILLTLTGTGSCPGDAIFEAGLNTGAGSSRLGIPPFELALLEPTTFNVRCPRLPMRTRRSASHRLDHSDGALANPGAGSVPKPPLDHFEDLHPSYAAHLNHLRELRCDFRFLGTATNLQCTDLFQRSNAVQCLPSPGGATLMDGISSRTAVQVVQQTLAADNFWTFQFARTALVRFCSIQNIISVFPPTGANTNAPEKAGVEPLIRSKCLVIKITYSRPVCDVLLVFFEIKFISARSSGYRNTSRAGTILGVMDSIRHKHGSVATQDYFRMPSLIPMAPDEPPTCLGGLRWAERYGCLPAPSQFINPHSGLLSRSPCLALCNSGRGARGQWTFNGTEICTEGPMHPHLQRSRHANRDQDHPPNRAETLGNGGGLDLMHNSCIGAWGFSATAGMWVRDNGMDVWDLSHFVQLRHAQVFWSFDSFQRVWLNIALFKLLEKKVGVWFKF
ncbi:hypothetical protein FB451DRAFT_1185438 [Mycena latifolia]|nr:hypothetical protein FB451DRAFT_1185438 [Mycena latifolia]